MNPINYFKKTPDELVIYIADDLENAVEIVSLATTCQHILGIFTKMQEHAFLNLFPNIIRLKSKNFLQLPCSSITINGFKNTREMLYRFFLDKLPYHIIEGTLRNFLATDANKIVMTVLSTEYLDVSATNRKFKKIQKALEVELHASKNEVDARIVEICGPNGNDGKIHEAYHACRASDDALAANFCALTNSNLFNTDTEMAHQANLHAYRKHASAVKIYNHLCAELNTLIIWTGAQITGGKIFELQRDIADPVGAARRHSTKIGNFFAELSQDVQIDQFRERSKILNTILDQ